MLHKNGLYTCILPFMLFFLLLVYLNLHTFWRESCQLKFILVYWLLTLIMSGLTGLSKIDFWATFCCHWYCYCALIFLSIFFLCFSRQMLQKNSHPQKREHRNIFKVKKTQNLKPACFDLYCDIIKFKFLPQNQTFYKQIFCAVKTLVLKFCARKNLTKNLII